MSYSTKINDNQINLSNSVVASLFTKWGAQATVQGTFDNDLTAKIGDKTYTIKNIDRGSTSAYNLYDVIAIAKAAKVNNSAIADGLKQMGVSVPSGYNSWSNDTVKSLNIGTNAATQQVQDYLDKHYPNANAYVSVIMNSNGKGYKTRVVYTNPSTGAKEYVPLDLDSHKALSNESISKLLGANSGVGQLLSDVSATNTANTNTVNNANAQLALANKVSIALQGNVGSNANAYNNLTQADIDAVTAQLPGTENLQAWNQSKNTNALSTALKNIQDTNPELIERASLQELQGLASDVSNEQLRTTQRNINNQQRQLLQQIQRDPELYEAITNQLRVDNAAGTIAGQRAANAQQFASQADATYDKSASDLYSSLFTGDTAVADATRNSVMSNQASASDAYIQSMLNNAIEAARQGQISSQDLATFISSMSTALDTDQSVYDNAIAEKQVAADGKASDISNKLDANLKTQTASQDAQVQQVSNILGVGTDYLQSASNGGSDVAAALNTIINSFANSGALSSGYKKVNTPAYQNAEQFTNQQYTDFINSDAFKTFLSDDTIDALTKTKTIEELLSENNLDMLTEEGMRSLYEGYATEANAQSNKVFNQAQRAYIAAVTAGDAKTTEQLAKLATNAGASKSNLYATSALANQLKQQFGLNNTGRQMATDFQNQQSANQAAIANAALSANKALTGYIGNGADGYDAGTLYAVKNLWDSNAANNRTQYGSLGNKLMSTTQGLNTSNVSNSINNYDRLAKLAGQYTTTNAAAAANNTANKATTNSLKTQAEAMKTQANTTLDTFKKANTFQVSKNK